MLTLVYLVCTLLVTDALRDALRTWYYPRAYRRERARLALPRQLAAAGQACQAACAELLRLQTAYATQVTQLELLLIERARGVAFYVSD